MTARDYFEGVRAAQRAIDRRLASLAAMREREGLRAQRYDAVGRGSGPRDVMAATDARIDAEERSRAELGALYAEVSDAREVCRGLRAACPHRAEWGDVLEMRYCDALDWRNVADAMRASERQCRTWHDAALDFVDAHGLARVREGCGQAALF